MGRSRVRNDPRYSVKLIYLELWDQPELSYDEIMKSLRFSTDMELNDHLDALRNIGLYPFVRSYPALLWACTPGMWAVPHCSDAQAIYRLRRLAKRELSNRNVYHRILQYFRETDTHGD